MLAGSQPGQQWLRAGTGGLVEVSQVQTLMGVAQALCTAGSRNGGPLLGLGPSTRGKLRLGSTM